MWLTFTAIQSLLGSIEVHSKTYLEKWTHNSYHYIPLEKATRTTIEMQPLTFFNAIINGYAAYNCLNKAYSIWTSKKKQESEKETSLSESNPPESSEEKDPPNQE